jgi:hypothetical protein
LAIITIIFAAVLPQFRVIYNSWDSRQANTEVLQNGRVLIDHINRNLSKAVKITAVEPNYIQFLDNDSNTYRYDINPTSGYVRYGQVGYTPSDLAGPVSSLQFTCYDGNDFENAITDVNSIRFVGVQTILPNPAVFGQVKTFSTSAYLRTNAQGSDCWQNDDIGDVGASGSASESDGTWTINGSGAGIGGTSDAFHYVYQSLSGDGQIVARVVSMTNTNASAKAGVMIRETLDADSKHAMMVITPSSGTVFQRRTATGGSSDTTAGSSVTAPYWVKLVRSGNTFTGYESADGSAWTLVGSVSITMVADVYIGLAVTSYSYGVLCTAVIDNVGFSSVTYEGFTEAKAGSDTISITISTSGSVAAVLGSWTSGLTHTVEAGSNRALILIAHVEEAGAISLSSVTYGGQSMTKVMDQIVASAGYDAYVAAYILDEAGIAAATSNTFAPTWNTTPDNVSYSSVFLQDVDQTDLIGDSASNTSTSGNNLTTAALSTDFGDMVIDAATCGNTGDYTVNNSFSEAMEQDMASSTGTTGYKSATGADETPSVTHSGANRQVLIGFVVNGAISGIEGDLLIAAVATDGDTSASLGPAGGGWTTINVDDYSSAVTLGAWWRLAGASEPASHQFIWSGGNPQQAYGWMMHFTGHNPTPANTINAWSAGSDSNSTPTSPDVNTTVDNCLILRLGAFDNDNITVGNPGLTTPTLHTAITMNKSATGGSAILLQDGFETDFSKWTDGDPPPTNWDRTMAQAHSGSYSAHAGNSDDDLISDNLNTFGYSSIRIEFWYRDDDLDAGDASLQFYDGSAYDDKFDLGTNPEDTWNKYDVTINNSGGDAQYFISNFRIKFEATPINGGGENLWIDDVTVTATLIGTVSGGAGYVGQASSGGSNTSNFSLTASGQSRMLTIAIAPADTNDCQGSVQP